MQGLSRYSNRFKTRLVPVLVAGPLSTVLLVGGVMAQDSTPTTTPAGVVGDAIATDSCNLADYAATPTGTSALYSIVSDQSEARYEAEEEFVGQGANTAIGTTNAFIGQIGLDANGAPLVCSRFDVDLRTLVSDDSRRDNKLYEETLETGEFPLATFILTSVEGLNGGLVDGQETSVTLVGNLTLHGVTKLVAWSGTVKLDGDTLTGSAELSFNIADFDMVEPSSPQVLSIDDTIKLGVNIVAQKAA
ncbi:MAG: YceI family protein [Thermomicrobiales bacterium]